MKKQLAAGVKLPEIFMACGTEDFLLQRNREFHQFLQDQGVPHTYEEGPGIHDMRFWQEWAGKFIPLAFCD